MPSVRQTGKHIVGSELFESSFDPLHRRDVHCQGEESGHASIGCYVWKIGNLMVTRAIGQVNDSLEFGQIPRKNVPNMFTAAGVQFLTHRIDERAPDSLSCIPVEPCL